MQTHTAASVEQRAFQVRDAGLRRLSDAGYATPDAGSIEALMKVGILLAHQGASAESDVIIESLLPYADEVGPEQQSALCELLTLKGRIIDAEEIADGMDPITRMLTQIRCLPSRLVRAAEAHGSNPERLAVIVEVILNEPLNALERVANASNGGGLGQAHAAYAATRMLTRTLQSAIVRDPRLGPIIETITGEAPENIDAVAEAAVAMAVDAMAPSTLEGHEDRLLDEANALLGDDTDTDTEKTQPPDAFVTDRAATLRRAMNGSG